MAKEIVADKKLVAYCGLYCGACKRYLAEKCPGCRKNEKAKWCGVRTCCLSHDFGSCADCKTFGNLMDCKKFNNFFSKIFSILLGSNRRACIQRIKEVGEEKYASEMAEEKIHSIRNK